MWTKHNYFGPGDSNYDTNPIDEDDEIARRHDLSYDAATSYEDIHSADAEAVKAFGANFRRTFNWHSALGAVSLGSKYVVEELTGTTIYPSNFKKKPAEEGNLTSHETSKGTDTSPEQSAAQPRENS